MAHRHHRHHRHHGYHHSFHQHQSPRLFGFMNNSIVKGILGVVGLLTGLGAILFLFSYIFMSLAGIEQSRALRKSWTFISYIGLIGVILGTLVLIKSRL